MTLIELGKLTDLDFDQNFENWPPIDPPTPPNDNLTPLWGKIFSAELFKTFLHFRLSLDLVTTSPVEKTPYISFWGPPGGVKGGVRGAKKFFWLKMLKIA